MFHFFQNPSLHRQVSDEMMTLCNAGTQKMWSAVIDVFRKGIAEGVLKSELNPAECAVILWSSADAILTRIDYEYEKWKQRLDVDLARVFSKSNALLLQSMMTQEAEEKYSSLFDEHLTFQLSE